MKLTFLNAKLIKGLYRPSRVSSRAFSFVGFSKTFELHTTNCNEQPPLFLMRTLYLLVCMSSPTKHNFVASFSVLPYDLTSTSVLTFPSDHMSDPAAY